MMNAKEQKEWLLMRVNLALHFAPDEPIPDNSVKKLLDKEFGYLTFNVPDGVTHKVLNNKGHLEKYKKKLQKNIKTFSVPKKQGSTPLTVVKNFIKDKEYCNAIQAAELADIELGYGRYNDGSHLILLNSEPVDLEQGRDFIAGLHNGFFRIVDVKTGFLSDGFNENEKAKFKTLKGSVEYAKAKFKTLPDSKIEEMFSIAESDAIPQEEIKESILNAE